MLNQIKVYWYKEKTEYEDRYKQAFLKDYEKSIEYLEKMKSYLLDKKEENPQDIDFNIAVTFLNIYDKEIIDGKNKSNRKKYRGHRTFYHSTNNRWYWRKHS